MPRIRHLSAYASAHYYRLFQRVIETDAPVLLPMSKSKAATLRGEIYAWRRTAEKEPPTAIALGIDLNLIRRVALRIGDEGLEVVPESSLAGPAAIVAALGPIAPLTPLPTPADASLERLKAALGQGERPLPYATEDEHGEE